MPPIAQRPTWLGSRWSARLRHERVLVAAPERDVVVAAVGRDAHERLRHEAREDVQLAADLPADLAEGGEVVGRPLGAVEVEVELDLARRVLVVALDHVEPERLPVLDHLVDDRLELAELVDVVAVRLRDAADVGRAVLLQVQPHHLRLGACAKVEPGRLLELRLDPLQVAAAVGGEERRRVLLLLPVAEARAPDAGDLAVPGQHLERVGLGDPDELGRLGAVPDVVAVTVGEEVRGRAVDELEAFRRHALPVRGGNALAHDPAGDRDELVVDVGDSLGVDAAPDVGDELVAALCGDEAVEIGCHVGLLFHVVRAETVWVSRPECRSCHHVSTLAGGSVSSPNRPPRDSIATSGKQRSVLCGCPCHWFDPDVTRSARTRQVGSASVVLVRARWISGLAALLASVGVVFLVADPPGLLHAEEGLAVLPADRRVEAGGRGDESGRDDQQHEWSNVTRRGSQLPGRGRPRDHPPRGVSGLDRVRRCRPHPRRTTGEDRRVVHALLRHESVRAAVHPVRISSLQVVGRPFSTTRPWSDRPT